MRIADEYMIAVVRTVWCMNSDARAGSGGAVSREWIQCAVARNFACTSGSGGEEARLMTEVVRNRMSSRISAVAAFIPWTATDAAKWWGERRMGLSSSNGYAEIRVGASSSWRNRSHS